MGGSSPAAFMLYITFYVALSFLSILMVYSILCHCCRGPYNNGNLPMGPTSYLHMGNGGLEPTVIEGFPKFTYSNKGIDMDMDTDTDMNGECVVCLGVFEENEMLRLLPKCGHVFHVDCIDTWLQSHVTCPLCRANLLAGDYLPHYIPSRAEV